MSRSVSGSHGAGSCECAFQGRIQRNDFSGHIATANVSPFVVGRSEGGEGRGCRGRERRDEEGGV